MFYFVKKNYLIILSFLTEGKRFFYSWIYLVKQGRIPDSLEDSTITYKWLLSNFDDGEKITDSEITILEFLKQRDSTNEAKKFWWKILD